MTSLIKILAAVAAGTSHPSPLVSMTAGNTFTCVARIDGMVECYGVNNYGQLGDGGTQNSAFPSPVDGLNATSVSGGEEHVCAVGAGNVWCWGSCSSGECASVAYPQAQTEPLRVDLPLAAVETCAGMYFSMAVMEDGSVYGWGSNLYGVLSDEGLGGETWGGYDATPMRISPPGSVSEARCGQVHVCFLDDAGSLGCRGFSNFGQIPGAGFGLVLTTHQVHGVWTSVAVGAWHTCAVQNGTVWCSGASDDYQAGDPQRKPRMSMERVVGVPQNVARVFASGLYTVALTETGDLWFWGDGSNGESGLGTHPGPVWPPRLVASHVENVATGYTHVVIEQSDLAWARATGTDEFGELGLGVTSTRVLGFKSSLLPV